MRLALNISNPKRRGPESLQSAWYRYYAGFSEKFAESVLSTAGLLTGQLVLDPWNGSGTTTSRAVSLGLNACGFDLNPVMVLVAKARCLDPAEFPSLQPLSADLLRKANKQFDPNPSDPLLTWLLPRSVAAIRSIEAAIQTLLVENGCYLSLEQRGVDGISDLAAFFYVVLFRALRDIIRPFFTSNPTWVKQPASPQARLSPSTETLREKFRIELARMLPQLPRESQLNPRNQRVLKVASSEQLPISKASVDFILSSPPYCTRIDYAVATSVELALLGYGLDTEFAQLRRKLIGNATVPTKVPGVSNDWGNTCLAFLDALSAHTSKASSTYYYKNHLQYFQSISASVSELSRVLKVGGRCILVIQDSFYKDLHNNLPQIFVEMAGCRGLELREKHDFRLSQTLAVINPKSNDYRNSFSAIESVLVIEKSGC